MTQVDHRPSVRNIRHNDWEWIPVEEIVPIEDIDLKREAGGFEHLKQSIIEDGFFYPVLLWRSWSGRGYEQSNGHHRLAASQDLGYTHIPAIINGDRIGDSGWDAIFENDYAVSSGHGSSYWRILFGVEK